MAGWIVRRPDDEETKKKTPELPVADARLVKYAQTPQAVLPAGSLKPKNTVDEAKKLLERQSTINTPKVEILPRYTGKAQAPTLSTMPKVDALAAAKQIQQRAQGKTPEQLRQQNIANIKEGLSGADARIAFEQATSPKPKQTTEAEPKEGILGPNLWAGWTRWNQNWASSVDNMLPDNLTPKPVQGVLDYYQRVGQEAGERAAKINEEQKVPELGATLIQGTATAIPDLILAWVSGGLSLTGTGATTLTNAAANPTVLNTVKKVVQNLAKNPNYWRSVMQMFGPSVDAAKENGASDLEAVAFGMLYTMPAAGLEAATGLENMVQNPKGVLNWLKGMNEEGLEEVLQGVTERLAAKSTYAPETEWASLIDQNAVINPGRAVQEYAGGAGVAGILGAPVNIAGLAAEIRADRQAGKNTELTSIAGENAKAAALAGALTEGADPEFVLRAREKTRQQMDAKMPPQEVAPQVQEVAPQAQETAPPVQKTSAQAETTPKALPQTERRSIWDAADKLKKEYRLNMGDEDLRGKLEKVFEGFKTQGWTDETAARLNNLAAEMVERSGGVLNEAESQPARDAKKYLRTTQIGITPSMKAELESLYGNYNQMRKHNMGKLNLKLVLEGDRRNSVDMLYDQLHEIDPGHFPAREQETNDKDLMAKIVDFVNGDTEVYDYPFEEDREGAAKWLAGQMVQQYANIYRETAPDYAKDAEAHRKARAAEKELEAVEAQAKLTEEEKQLVRDMIQGRIAPQMVTDPRLQRVYEAKVKNYAAQRDARATKANQRKKYKTLAKELTETADDWKDKKGIVGLAYDTETAERNVRDIVKDKALANRIVAELFTPVHENEAQATRLKNQLRARLKNLNLGTKAEYLVAPQNGEPGKYSESALVQMYGEGKLTEDQVRKSGANLEKIAGAANEFRQVYDQLLDMANKSLVANGYAPVEKRANYFPHWEEPEPRGIAKALNWMGIKIRESSLPTTIAGITDTFRPGKKYVANFQQRQGDRTEFDALKGFDRYIDSVADVIFHTDDIQRLRAFENEVRYQSSSKGTQERVRNIQDDPFMDEDAKQEAIRKIFDADPSSLAGFVTWVRKYTDTLAGKKDFGDRDWEYKVGRGMYDTMTGLERRISANMVGGNISSAFTNFIPIFQGLGEVKAEYMAQALKDAGRSIAKDDGFANRSDFLTNRRGTDQLSKTAVEKVSDAAGVPFEIVDRLTSETVTRARYLQNVAEGMEADAALREADAWAASLMADRSKGATPVIFNAKNPRAKAFTMFQIEVNNQYRYMFKDLPRNMQEQGKTAIAGALFKMFLATGLFGEVFEKLFGYDPTFNPISILKDLISGLRDEKKDNYTVVTDAVTEAAEQIPFLGNVMGGGRIPVADALQPLAEIPVAAGKAILGKTSGKKALSDIGQSAVDLASVTLLPFGGNQLKKTGQGIAALAKGRVSSLDKEGQEQLQYLVEPTAGNIAKGITAGKWSFPEAKEYVESGFKKESAKNTDTILRAPEEAGITSKVAKSVVDNLKKQDGTAAKRRYIYNQPGLSAEQKAWLEHELLASDKVKEKAELALTRGIPLQTFYWVNANSQNQVETTKTLNRAIGLNRQQKAWLWKEVTGGADKNNPFK